MQSFESLKRLSALNFAKNMTKSISFTKKICVDKNKRGESLIQSKEINEEEHVVFSYHINDMKKFVHWLNKNVNVVEFMLFQLRKEMLISLYRCFSFSYRRWSYYDKSLDQFNSFDSMHSIYLMTWWIVSSTTRFRIDRHIIKSQ